MSDRPEIVCLCGSLRFADELRVVARDLTLGGAVVLAPVDLGSHEPTEEQRRALGRLHLRRIDIADRVVVVNPGGYVGEAVTREVAHARATGTPVSFTDSS